MVFSAGVNRKKDFSTEYVSGPRQAVESNAFPAARRAFTILELLIVLGILGMVLAVAWPQMKRRIARSHLKQVAIELKEQIANAREHAIQSGEVFELRFAEGQSDYLIGPSRRLPKPDQENRVALATAAAQVFEQIEIGTDPTDQNEISGEGWIVSQSLDESYQLVSRSRLSESESSQSATSGETIVIGSEEADTNSNLNVSQNAILFTPDGRSEDFEIMILDSPSRLALAVRIRGLTGQAEIGEITVLNSDVAQSESDAPAADEGKFDTDSFDLETDE